LACADGVGGIRTRCYKNDPNRKLDAFAVLSFGGAESWGHAILEIGAAPAACVVGCLSDNDQNERGAALDAPTAALFTRSSLVRCLSDGGLSSGHLPVCSPSVPLSVAKST